MDEALRQQQKIDGVGLLAAGVAHDFNNLLAVIMGGASFAIEQMSSEHPARAMLDIVLGASERASHLTHQLLAAAGKAQVSKQPVSLAKLIPETCGLLRASIPKRIGISCDLPDDLPAIEADPSQVHQIVMNLVINGSDAIGEKTGHIRLRANALDIDETNSAVWWPGRTPRSGEYVLMEVTDTGAGMDEVTLSQVFDPFFTTKFAGRGLGLAAVAGIVRGMDGTISVVSAPGEGATFRILFPAIEEAVAVPAYPAAPSSQPARGVGILVVDDEEIVRKTIFAITQRTGAQPWMAHDGASGVELFRERHAEISLIVLDINMPGQPLVETIQGFRKIRNDIPILLVTGYSSQEIDVYLKRFDRMRFLLKPFKAHDLQEAISDILESAKPSARSAGGSV